MAKNQNKKSIITLNFSETQNLGETFGKSLLAGDVVALYGDLGAGKTTFVQGIAKGLGIIHKVISPTFPIIRHYGMEQGSFYHIDLYRIESEKDTVGLEIKEVLEDPHAIVVIEWPEKIRSLLPARRKEIHFVYIEDNTRNITFLGI